jgi:hypothetical protein
MMSFQHLNVAIFIKFDIVGKEFTLGCGDMRVPTSKDSLVLCLGCAVVKHQNTFASKSISVSDKEAAQGRNRLKVTKRTIAFLEPQKVLELEINLEAFRFTKGFCWRYSNEEAKGLHLPNKCIGCLIAPLYLDSCGTTFLTDDIHSAVPDAVAVAVDGYQSRL